MINPGGHARIEAAVSGLGPATPAADRGTLSLGGVTAAVDAKGRAAFDPDISALPLGVNEISVSYSGNSTLPAASGVATVTVMTGTTKVAIVPRSAAIYGAPWEFGVEITAPDGWVTFLPFILEVDGVVTPHENERVLRLNLTMGPHTILARYEGSDDMPPADSPLLTINVVKPDPGITCVAGAARAGTAPTVVFSFHPQFNTLPSGTLELREGTSLLVRQTFDDRPFVSVNLPVLALGAHQIRATYSGDARYASVTVDFTVYVLPTNARHRAVAPP